MRDFTKVFFFKFQYFQNEFVDDPRTVRAVDEHVSVVDQTSKNGEQLPITGRRIVKIAHLFQQIADMSKHSALYDCSFADMILIHERQRGFVYDWKFRCKLCGMIKIVTSDDCDLDTRKNE